MKSSTAVLVYALALLIGKVAYAEPPSGCEVVHEWVKANTANLPRTYEDLSRFSMPYRRAIFAELVPEEKADLWRHHLNSYLEQHSEQLNYTQRDLIGRAIDLTEAEFFRHRTRTRAEVFNNFIEEAKRAFNRESVLQIFGQLGPEAGDLPVSEKGQTKTHVECVCYTGSDFCGQDFLCTRTECRTSSRGCGWWWSEPCNGECLD